jgi:hypothetical protein
MLELGPEILLLEYEFPVYAKVHDIVPSANILAAR